MLRILLFGLLLSLPVPSLADDGVAVAHVINGKSFVLASGETVRLASIEAPNVEQKADGAHASRPAEPLGEQAKAALEKLVMGHKVRIAANAVQKDRHERLLGQAYRDDGLWIQGELLKQGFAMVYSFSDDDAAVIQKMLAQEHEAQTAKRGIWADPYFRVIAPLETEQFVGRFKLVEGKVVSVNDYHGHTYINFSERWKGNFSVFISRKYANAFAAMNLPSLAGRIIRVRGWIDYHNAPTINLTHPAQIELE